tara:strand:+ start:134 stop:400 length:267 start_codon:yes stop_codon:yes gene_type:complete
MEIIRTEVTEGVLSSYAGFCPDYTKGVKSPRNHRTKPCTGHMSGQNSNLLQAILGGVQEGGTKPCNTPLSFLRRGEGGYIQGFCPNPP